MQSFETEDKFLAESGQKVEAEIAHRLQHLEASMRKEDLVDKELQRTKRREKLAALKAKLRQANAAAPTGGAVLLGGGSDADTDAGSESGDSEQSADSNGEDDAGSDGSEEIEQTSAKRKALGRNKQVSKRRRRND